jgi:hypothetical protein
LHQLTIILGKLVLSGCFEELRVQEELIYLVCQNSLGRGKGKKGGTKKGEVKVLNFLLSAPGLNNPTDPITQ